MHAFVIYASKAIAVSIRTINFTAAEKDYLAFEVLWINFGHVRENCKWRRNIESKSDQVLVNYYLDQ